MSDTDPETPADTLRRYIAEAKARRQEVALGEAVIDVWRGGRRMKMTVTSIAELNAYIGQMERELEAILAGADGRPRRRAIRLGWPN